MICGPCRAGRHCGGKFVLAVPGGRLYCVCGCGPTHTIPTGDARLDMFAVLTAATETDDELLRALVRDLSDENKDMLIWLLAKWSVMLMGRLNDDPKEVIREAATYWQGGPGPDPS